MTYPPFTPPPPLTPIRSTRTSRSNSKTTNAKPSACVYPVCPSQPTNLPPPPQDVQDLLLWVAGEGLPPRWAFVRHKALFRSFLLIALDGFDLTAAPFPFLADHAATSHPLHLTNSEVTGGLAQSALSVRKAPKKRAKSAASPLDLRLLKHLDHSRPSSPCESPSKRKRSEFDDAAAGPQLSFPFAHLLGDLSYPLPADLFVLSEEDMRGNKYPMEGGEGWARAARSGSEANEPERIFAMDCEMVPPPPSRQV
jgi:hypothetical protein